MAIRRVTGAVSPSELIFADANALGATYDGSGTTIERGETFTLPAGGTTAVSNGALRLEALKGDCTITNNGNSTLTNASGVDGTIVMRSGASDFPAFVRNSSMGSMSTPAREDFTGSLLGAGTFDGTINSNATFPAGHVIGMKAVTLENTNINDNSGNFVGVSQLDLSINRTSGTRLLYFLQGGGGFTAASANSIYIKIERSDGTSYSSTNLTVLSNADGHGHSRLYANVASILVPYSVMAYDNASVSGNKTYRTFYRGGASGESVTFQESDRAMITAMIMEFIPTT